MWPCGSSGAPHSGHGGRPAGDDPRRARDERARGGGGDPDAQQVRAVLVLVVVLVGIDLLAVLVLGARLDEDALGVAVPAERQRTGAERLVERLVERAACRRRRLPRRPRRLGGLDAAPLELVEQLAEPVGEDRDLDLLEDDADDAAAVAGLQEERPIARLADRAGHEALGRIEEVATSGHA